MNEILPLSDRRSIPPLSALIAFERAALRQSFRQAARDLALTPSAVSHQVRGLESLFGVKLFIRDARSVRLTIDGERYLERITGALKVLEESGREFLERLPGKRDELWISATPFFTSAVLLPALPAFRKKHPHLTLRIEATHQYADFANSRVDVAVRYGRESGAGLRFEKLVEVGSLAVCSPRLVKAGLTRPEDLARHTLIGLTVQPRSWALWLADAGLPDLQPGGRLWLDSVPAALEAAEQGLGVAIALDPLIRLRPGFGKTLVAPFALAAGQRETLHLVSRTEQRHDRRITLLRQWIREAVGRAAPPR